MKKLLVGALLGSAAIAYGNAWADDTIKVGFIASLSGNQAVVGRELLDGFNLAVKELGGKLGNMKAEILVRDDQGKPDAGAQAAERLVQRDRASIVTGVNLSNVLLAVVPKVAEANRTFISLNAGPSVLAGSDCSSSFFSVAHQNDTVPEAMGMHLNKVGVKNLYIMAPNFAAGKDMVAGLKRTYKGGVAAEVYTQFGQLDYSAELAKLRSAKPDALYVFYPGGMGINFFKQLAQAGLKDEIPVYGVYATDQTVLPAIGEAALGVESTAYWSEQLDNDLNRRFVSSFEKEYNRIPSPYAAMAYDGARLIDAALKANGNKYGSAKDFARAMHTPTFRSIRGDFKFNTNNFPIQSHYLLKVEKDAQGRLVNVVTAKINDAYADAYVGECKLSAPKS